MEDSNNTLSLLSLNSSTSVATHQLDCQGGWLMVHKDLNGRITSQEDLKYGESCINSSETLPQKVILNFSSFPRFTALQCTGRNPSNKSIQQYWTQYGGEAIHRAINTSCFKLREKYHLLIKERAYDMVAVSSLLFSSSHHSPVVKTG